MRKEQQWWRPARAGMVKRVRGVAHCTRVAPAAAARMVDGARGVLNALLADVFVFTDAMAGAEGGASPGFGLALAAETTAGLLLGAQAASPPPVRARLPYARPALPLVTVSAALTFACFLIPLNYVYATLMVVVRRQPPLGACKGAVWAMSQLTVTWKAHVSTLAQDGQCAALWAEQHLHNKGSRG